MSDHERIRTSIRYLLEKNLWTDELWDFIKWLLASRHDHELEELIDTYMKAEGGPEMENQGE